MPRKKKSKKRSKRKKPAIEYRYITVQSNANGINEVVLQRQKWNAETETWETIEG